jgi:hypothetical protein
MSPKWGRLVVAFGIVILVFLIATNIAVWAPPDPASEWFVVLFFSLCII